MDGLSDHDLLFFVYDLYISSNSTECITYRDFNAIDTDALQLDCLSTDWNCPSYCANVDNKLELLSPNIIEVFNTHVPLETRIIKKSKPQWFQGEVKLATKNRSKMEREVRSFKY